MCAYVSERVLQYIPQLNVEQSNKNERSFKKRFFISHFGCKCRRLHLHRAQIWQEIETAKLTT